MRADVRHWPTDVTCSFMRQRNAILRKMYGQETIRQVFKEFPGAKIKNVKIKGDLNDDLVLELKAVVSSVK